VLTQAAAWVRRAADLASHPESPDEERLAAGLWWSVRFGDSPTHCLDGRPQVPSREGSLSSPRPSASAYSIPHARPPA
jgi:hypothetical protein